MFTFDTDENDEVGSASGNLIGGAVVSGGVLNLDGGNDYLQMSGNLLPTDGSDFTLAFQALNSRTSQSGIHEIVSQGTSGGPGFYVGNINGQVRFTDQFGAISTPTPTDGLFHDYVVTSEVGVGTKLYLDGTEVFSSATPISIGGSTPTRIGTQFNMPGATPFNEYFQGQVDNFFVFDGALGSGEVKTVFSDVVLAPVPLPPSSILLIGGFAGLAFLRRRRTVTRAQKS
ncbi:LamG-like jellyroll fold domain-containing protein [Ruegeria arenilitoris]|uniref:LamG-like jellyroll fold domain-containing protein n=1 Tax=Ruegeria arenilitoris TaxID=1173585 RepID=UPI00147B6B57|nr:LamG-like jellyroll fold domain-containing protein [Ruegeria arenilitoris]